LKLSVIFPCDYFNPKNPDSEYAAEYQAAKDLGFNVALFNHDDFINEHKLDIKISKTISPAIYRGWMMKPEEYLLFRHLANNRGYNLIVDSAQYKTCHLFPMLYKYIKAYTPTAIWFKQWSPDTLLLLKDFFETGMIIKDYVKSNVKFSRISPDISLDTFDRLIRAFIDERGELFTEGIVIKEYVKPKIYGGRTNEWRAFFFNNELIYQNPHPVKNVVSLHIPSTDWLTEIAKKIPSKFFTLDCMELEDGTFTILEGGDGQVSGLPTDTNFNFFYSAIKSNWSKNEEA
jgi:hypothetical protein